MGKKIPTENNGGKTHHDNKVIHLGWALVIAVLIIASILGLIFCSDRAGKILSSISTVVSIILSILAILFTMWQAYKSEQYSDEIRKTIHESIRDNMHNITDLKGSIDEINMAMKAIVNTNDVSEIKENAEKVIESLESLSENFWFDD